MERIVNLGEKIYLACYGRPRYQDEIARLIYGKKAIQVNREIKNLENKGWIKKATKKEIENDIPPSIRKGDGRAKKRHYYYANYKLLYNEIIKKLEKQNLTLNKKIELIEKKETSEEDRLRIFLNGMYRGLVDEWIPFIDFKECAGGFDFVFDHLSWVSQYTIFSSEHLKDIQKRHIKNGKKIKKFIDWKEKILGNFFSKMLNVKLSTMGSTNELLISNLGKNLISKLTCLSHKTRFFSPYLLAFADEIEEETILLNMYRRDVEDIPIYDFDSWLKKRHYRFYVDD